MLTMNVIHALGATGNYMNSVTEVLPDLSLHDDVRDHDYDRYLSILFAPDNRRFGLLALLALNLELARVRDRVREPTLGQIRLAWWHETIKGVFENRPRRHPVAQALADTVDRYNIPRVVLDSMIDARVVEFDEQGLPTLETLENFAEQTSGALHRVCLKVLGVEDPQAETAAGHVGTAWALVGLVRSVPHYASMGRVYLPVDALSQADLTLGDVLSLTSGSRLKPVVETVLRCASQHLLSARDMKSQIPREALPALLPAVLADNYISRLRRHDFNPFALSNELNQTVRQLRLLWASLRRVF